MDARQFYTPASVTLSPNTSELANKNVPTGDRIWFYDQSAGNWTFLKPNDNLTISGTNLNVTGLAPVDADYLVHTANVSLTAERVVTDTTSVAVDWATAGLAKFYTLQTVVVNASASVSPAATDSGTSYRLTNAGVAVINLPAGSGCTIGVTTFYGESTTAGFQATANGTDKIEGLVNNEDGTFSPGAVTTRTFAQYQFAEFRYVASGRWALIGTFSHL